MKKKLLKTFAVLLLSSGFLFASGNKPSFFNSEKKNISLDNGSVSAENDNQSVFIADDGKSYTIKKTDLNKNSGDSSDESQSAFYGLNSALLALNGSYIGLEGVFINTYGDGSSAISSSGNGSSVNADEIVIRTNKKSSRGLDASLGGKITAWNVDIQTRGNRSAAFSTDGGGTISVEGGRAVTAGTDSPLVYSTGDVSLKKIKGKASVGQIACIDGKKRVFIEDSTLEGGSKEKTDFVNSAIMLYQSADGDSENGKAVFSAKSSSLKNNSNGPFFYITNTDASINLNACKLSGNIDELLLVSGNDSPHGFGKAGANGGNVIISVENQILTGEINVDSISSATVNLMAGAKYSGSLNTKKVGHVNLSLADSAKVTLTANCYVDAFSDENPEFSNIMSSGHIIYYNKNNPANSKLGSRTYNLPGGGKLTPIAY